MGLEPVIIDNCSTYEPLLEWYAHCDFKVVRMDKNYGHKVIWTNWMFRDLGIKDKYILTDPDLDLSGVPSDFLEVMEEGLKRYPKFERIGLSLEIDDLPDNDLGRQVYKHELRFWNKPLDEMYFEAEVDTTFALQKIGMYNTYNSLRINKPYTARHIPWYYTDLENLSIDEKNYIKTAGASFSWKDKIVQ
jgi:hypothetical protein